LVVLGDPIGTGGGTGFDLARIGRDDNVGNCDIFSFTGAMGDDRRPTIVFRHLDRLQGFGQSADLVELDQDGIGDATVNTTLDALGIGDEKVIPHKLQFLPNRSVRIFQPSQSSSASPSSSEMMG